MKTKKIIDLISGIIIGLLFGFVFFALWIGMGKEIDRQEFLKKYYCENYGYCK